MLLANHIKPVASRWSVSIAVALKPDGSPCLCNDYRSLNNEMKAEGFPIPNMEEIVEYVSESEFFITMDLFSGYCQIPMAEDSKEMTTFTRKFGTFSWELTSFGLMNAPATFQLLTSSLIADLPFVRVYIDGGVVLSKTLQEHVGHDSQIIQRLAEAHLRTKLKK